MEPYVTFILSSDYRSRHTKCLNKTALGESMHHSLVASFPGDRYSRDEQCKAFLGPEALECESLDGELCHRLWCRLSPRGRCLTYAVKWAVGTPCGFGKVSWSADKPIVMRRRAFVKMYFSDFFQSKDCNSFYKGYKNLEVRSTYVSAKISMIFSFRRTYTS